jgi:hypothetical protein
VFEALFVMFDVHNRLIPTKLIVGIFTDVGGTTTIWLEWLLKK